jgi:two-component system OmpR family sensor kinase
MAGPVTALQRLSDRTSLRTKLITAVLALVILALAVISVASAVMLHKYVTTARDTQLQSDWQHLTVRAGPSGATAANVSLTPTGEVAGIQLPGHQLAWASSLSNPYMSGGASAGTLPALSTDPNWAAGNTPVLVTAPSQSGPDTWRVMAEQISNFPVDTGGSQPQLETVTAVLAVNLGDVNAFTTRFVLFDLIVGGAIVLVLAAVAVGVVRANLRPLDDIEMTAGQIAKGHLDHRVPEGDPRTEIGSLGRSLNAMLSQIEAAFHAQEESEQAAHQSEERMRRFIADASHELRTPLTTIRGFAAHYRQRGGASGFGDGVLPGGAVSDGSPSDESSRTVPFFPATANGAPDGASDGGAGADPTMSPADLDRLMGRVESEAARMGLLVEDLLTLARLDQQRPLNIAPVDLLTLAADAVQDARVVAAGRPVDLLVSPGTAFLVDGDEARLRQVLANLVNNALTHTPSGTPVRVRLSSGTLRTGAPAAVIDVEDDGPGMSAEQAQRVFERFYRADAARNRASGGTGLGLAIVAGLVQAHGGTVGVRTAPGAGADFQVKLPLSPDAQALDDDPIDD